MTVTAGATTTTWTVVRNSEGTGASTHANGAPVLAPLTNGNLTGMFGQFAVAGTWTADQNFGTHLLGTLQTAAQPNITSLGALTGLTMAGAISGVTTLTATTLNGTLGTAAQGNVTSLGTLTSLTVSGALTATGTTTLNTTNISSGYILKGYTGPSSNQGPYFYTIGWGGQGRTIFTASTRNDTYAQEGDILVNA